MGQKAAFSSSPKKGDFGIIKNYWDISVIAFKVYNALFLNPMQPKIEKVLMENRTVIVKIVQKLFRIWLFVESSKEFV